MNKAEYKEFLKNNVCVVTFTKASGEVRTMRCTLQSEYLPNVVSESAGKRADNDAVVAVWDVDANGWRSWRIDSVVSFEPEVVE